jgi:hypothetical protein
MNEQGERQEGGFHGLRFNNINGWFEIFYVIEIIIDSCTIICSIVTAVSDSQLMISM